MTEFTIEVQECVDKAKQIRNDGNIPAIVYGKNFDNARIAVDQIVFKKVYGEAGTSNLIDLKLNGKNIKTLVHDIQIDPLTGETIHIDFMKVNMKEKIHAEIPLEFIGEAPAVAELEGSLINPIDSIEVECLPGDLVSEIQVDLSVLKDFEGNIKVSDLKVPAGVEILSDPEEIIAYVQEPKSEEELEAELAEPVVENVEEVEVEHKGEETPEGEAPAEAEEKAEE